MSWLTRKTILSWLQSYIKIGLLVFVLCMAVFVGLRAVRSDPRALEELAILSLKIALFVPLLIGFIFILLSGVTKAFAAVSTRRRARMITQTKQRLQNEYIVELTDHALSVTDPKENIRSVQLNKITSISVETNDSGPWGADVWFVIAGEVADEICAYPLGATHEDKALDYFYTLPGFILKGMDSTGNEQFICWEKPSAAVAD